MTGIDAALAALPLILEQQERIERKVDQLLARAADDEARWVTQTAWAKEMGVSTDTAGRLVARNEVEIREVGPPVPLKGKDGEQLRDRLGRPRFRRNIRLKLARPTGAAAIRAIAAAMVAPS